MMRTYISHIHEPGKLVVRIDSIISPYYQIFGRRKEVGGKKSQRGGGGGGEEKKRKRNPQSLNH